LFGDILMGNWAWMEGLEFLLMPLVPFFGRRKISVEEVIFAFIFR
jgi:hypothetical protein